MNLSASIHALLLFAHLAAAIIWLGGMAFAHFALRPAAVQLLEPPQRLPLMCAAMGRFFRWVAVAVLLILSSGSLLLCRLPDPGMVPLGWHVMAGLGLLMTLVFAFIYGRLYPALRRAVDQQQWPLAGGVLQRIRALVLLNMGLGWLAVAAAVWARI